MALFPQQDDQQHEYRDNENERDERIPVHSSQPTAPLNGAPMTTLELDEGDNAELASELKRLIAADPFPLSRAKAR